MEYLKLKNNNTRSINTEYEISVDNKEDIIQLTLSSETPYLRFDENIGEYLEILKHDAENVDISRLNSSAPFLFEHDQMKQIGVFENAYLDDTTKTVKATVRFSKEDFPQSIYREIKDGIRKKVSVGYVVLEAVIVGKNEKGQTIVHVTKWAIREGSSVSMPADNSVGINYVASFARSEEFETKDILISLNENDDVTDVKEKNKDVESDTIDNENTIVENIDIKEKSEEIESKLYEKAKLFNLEKSDVADFLSRNEDVSKFEDFIKEKINLKKEKEKMEKYENWSLKKAIRSVYLKEDCDELRISREIAQERGDTNYQGGLIIPKEVKMRYTRNLMVTPSNHASGASNLVAETLQTSLFTDIAHPKSLIGNLGVRVVEGLVGNYAVPVKTQGSSTYWVGDSGASTESSPVFTKIVSTPKYLVSETRIGNGANLQMTPDAEMLVIDDMLKSREVALNQALINGLAANNQPVGILNTSGVSIVALGENGGKITRDSLIDLKKAIADNNYDADKAKYVINSKTQADLMKLKSDEGSGIYVWSEFSNECVVSNVVPSNLTKGTGTALSAVVFGDFSDVLLNLWGEDEIIIDPFTLANKGEIVLYMRRGADFVVRSPGSFSAIKDVKNS